MALLKNAAIAGAVGLAAGGAHIAAHRYFGQPQALAPAGVTQAGLAVVAASSLTTFLALTVAENNGLPNAVPSVESVGQEAYGMQNEYRGRNRRPVGPY